LEIIPARTPAHIETARQLFVEYEKAIGISLCFQDFESEVANLPGAYSPPRGELFIACDGGEAVGCVAVRPIEGDICEMKRLYVRSGQRGKAVGRKLAVAIVNRAREIGYAAMRLDTLDTMVEARTLYASLGFHEIPDYRFNPHPNAIYMELDLTRPA